MSTETSTGLEGSVKPDAEESCDNCDALPGAFPCAECYIAGEAEWPAA